MTVTDFTAGTGGDLFNINYILSHSLSGWDGSSNPFGGGFLHLEQNGADTDLKIDYDGGGDDYTTFVTLEGVTAAALTAGNFAPGFDPFA